MLHKSILKSYFFIFLSLFSFTGISNAADIRIALRANKGVENAIAQWQATADYLSQKIPEHRFIIIPFENNISLNYAIENGGYDFCLTNPASGVEHVIRYKSQPLATLVNKRQGSGYSKFGSVIFTLKSRSDINELKDVIGKTFIGVDELGFGGWRVAWREFLKNDINPYSDFKKLYFSGGKQQDVVYAVRDGKADVGSVRTDMLERLSASGKINIKNYKVINKKETKDFPFLHSSQLYPEWLFLNVDNTDSKLKTDVVKALFSITSEDTAAINGKYISWISPLDYEPVDDLLKELNVGPYEQSIKKYLNELTTKHRHLLFVFTAVTLILIFIILYILKLYKRVDYSNELIRKESISRTKLEQQLQHKQRIESLGELTGGIAHDINNILASILGYTELALCNEAVKDNDKVSGYLNQVIIASDKCAALVNQMLIFSRTSGDSEQFQKLSVADIIDEAYQLLRPILPSSTHLNVRDIDEDLYIYANPVMVSQVLMNLCINAKDAISNEHGTIIMKATQVEIHDATVLCDSCHETITNAYIAISIEDNGKGIDELTKLRIFEPFFSTKEVGKGTGMGLSMVHGIMHKHNGHILLNSTLNKGTEVQILFPQKNIEEITSDLSAFENDIVTFAEANPDKSIKTKNILIVDDEVSITIYLTELLQQLHGFDVKSFNDSEKALSYFKENHDEIDLVLTDQTMPNLTGIEMANEMREIDKSAFIILCSGFSEGIDDNAVADLRVNAYLEKPIQSNKLIKTINSLLK